LRRASESDGFADGGDADVANAQGVRGAEIERGAEDRILQLLEANPRIGIRGSMVPIFPPRPGDIEAWWEVLAKEPVLEPAIRELADELADGVGVSRVENRIGQLRLLGNGVVPACVAHSFCILLGKLVGIEPKGE
jgi:DNA (cytosine-5)-methyltransferase 1